MKRNPDTLVWVDKRVATNLMPPWESGGGASYSIGSMSRAGKGVPMHIAERALDEFEHLQADAKLGKYGWDAKDARDLGRIVSAIKAGIKSAKTRTNPSKRFRSLTSAEEAAVVQFARQHGRSWKRVLNHHWSIGATQGYLQQLRNELGPAWLNQYTLPGSGRKNPSRNPRLSAGDHIEVLLDGQTVRGWVLNLWRGGGAILVDNGTQTSAAALEAHHAGHGPGAKGYENRQVVRVLHARGPLRARKPRTNPGLRSRSTKSADRNEPGSYISDYYIVKGSKVLGKIRAVAFTDAVEKAYLLGWLKGTTLGDPATVVGHSTITAAYVPWDGRGYRNTAATKADQETAKAAVARLRK